jgi:hypothetical protein
MGIHQHTEFLPSIQWRSLMALLLSVFAQFQLELPAHLAPAVVFYAAALGFLAWAMIEGEWTFTAPPAEAANPIPAVQQVRIIPLLASLPFLITSFYFFSGNRFNALNLSLWLTGILFFILAFRVPRPVRANGIIDWESVALFACVFFIISFLRVHHIAAIPADPFSDHAEKIMDVFDISQGRFSIFFERNTGREAFQMYWSLLVMKLFGTGFTFLGLKIGTVLLGLAALPFMYLLGLEFGSPSVGFLALFLFGISYWMNVTSRIGLRFPLYPLFTAATLLYLTRGLRTLSRNDFLLCGIFLGLGLHGYSPFRIVPFVVILGFLLFILHPRSNESRLAALRGLGLVVITSFIIFLPLLRYWMEHADTFGFRALSRIGEAGTQYPEPVWIIFLTNLYRGLLMFNWDDGNIWVNSIPDRPAFDIVTGALFVLGIVLLMVRYFQKWDWRDLFLLLSIPVLLMPSVLALAFPLENPALNRAGGAAVAAILVSARALEGWLAGAGGAKKRLYLAYGISAVLLSVSVLQNYNLVFRTFDVSYRRAVWNSTEMARVIQEHGNHESAWIVPAWQWVDTRLPAIWLGDVYGDFALWPDEFYETTKITGPKLFIFKPEDLESEIFLKQIYPEGTLSRYTSASIGKDFMIFRVEK